MTAQSISTSPRHPLAATAGELERFGHRIGFRYGEPADIGWTGLAELGQPATIDRWLDEQPASHRGLRNVAAASIGLKLTCCVVRPLMASLHVTHRLPRLTPADVRVRRLSHDRFDELALSPVPVYVTVEDALAPDPGAIVVASSDELLEQAAATIYSLLSPTMDALRSRGRYGLRGLWGGVQDMIGATSLLVARRADLPQWAVWRSVERLLDHLGEQVSAARIRPQPFTVPWSGGEAMYTVKGTCCLRYREHGLRPADQSDRSDAFCHTCPFVDECGRRRHYQQELERQATGAPA